MTREHILDILPRLRLTDAHELLSGSRYETLEAWAQSRLSAAGISWTVLVDDVPMWIGGVLEGSVRGIGALWLVGAKGCEPFVMYACRVWQAVLEHGGYRRLEAKCFASNEPANRFAKIMGLTLEGTLRGYTREGEDVNQYGLLIGGAHGR